MTKPTCRQPRGKTRNLQPRNDCAGVAPAGREPGRSGGPGWAFSRRGFLATAAASTLPLAPPVLARTPLSDRIGGVRIGVCLFDFRDIPRLADPLDHIDNLVAACLQVGVSLVEINSTALEPQTRLPYSGIPRLWDQPLTGSQLEMFSKLTPAEVAAEREMLRRWRLTAPISLFEGVRRKFAGAGLKPFSYVFTFTPDMTEAEIDAVFRQVRALGLGVISTNQTKVEMAPRLVPFAERYKIDLGFHNHSEAFDPNVVASRDSLERLLSVSPRVKINLDLGHYTAGDQDEMGFMRERFDRITHIHLKDRKRHLGPNMPWGEGDTPIAQALTYIRERGADTPAIIEYEYPGTGTGITETKRCLDYITNVLTPGRS